jgi:hypothetical protein
VGFFFGFGEVQLEVFMLGFVKCEEGLVVVGDCLEIRVEGRDRVLLVGELLLVEGQLGDCLVVLGADLLYLLLVLLLVGLLGDGLCFELRLQLE